MTKFYQVFNFKANISSQKWDERKQYVLFFIQRWENHDVCKTDVSTGAPNLVELDLSWNKLESFPENFFTSVKNLQALNCANNEIKIFPQSLSKLEFLMHLDMSENHIKRVPPRIFANMKDLNYIDLSGNDLEEVGSGVFVGPGGTIKSLILAGNKIRTFPKSALQSLKWVGHSFRLLIFSSKTDSIDHLR